MKRNASMRVCRRSLDKRHPHYRAARSDLTQRDPARPYLRRVDMLRLAESPRQLLLFVAHAWGGGVRRHMDELAELIGDRCEVLLLEPAAGDTVKLSWPKSGEGFVAYFSLPQEMAALASLLGELGLARIHFHHIHGLPQAVLDLPGAAGLPYDCTLHDYYTICPQYHLVTEDGRYCGEPDAAGCAACISRRPSQWGLDIAAWREAFGALLHGAERVFAPSRDVAQRIKRYFPAIDVTVLPHAEAHAVAPRVVRVVTLGRLSPEKGLRVLTACAADARSRTLPLSFRVLGSDERTHTAMARCRGVDPRAVRGQRVAGADRRGAPRCDLVSIAGTRVVFVHAVGSAGCGRGHRCVCTGGVAGALGGQPSRRAGVGGCNAG